MISFFLQSDTNLLVQLFHQRDFARKLDFQFYLTHFLSKTLVEIKCKIFLFHIHFVFVLMLLPTQFNTKMSKIYQLQILENHCISETRVIQGI